MGGFKEVVISVLEGEKMESAKKGCMKGNN